MINGEPFVPTICANGGIYGADLLDHRSAVRVRLVREREDRASNVVVFPKGDAVGATLRECSTLEMQIETFESDGHPRIRGRASIRCQEGPVRISGTVVFGCGS